jgi:hypothetical protein
MRVEARRTPKVRSRSSDRSDRSVPSDRSASGRSGHGGQSSAENFSSIKRRLPTRVLSAARGGPGGGTFPPSSWSEQLQTTPRFRVTDPRKAASDLRLGAFPESRSSYEQSSSEANGARTRPSDPAPARLCAVSVCVASPWVEVPIYVRCKFIAHTDSLCAGSTPGSVGSHGLASTPISTLDPDELFAFDNPMHGNGIQHREEGRLNL